MFYFGLFSDSLLLQALISLPLIVLLFTQQLATFMFNLVSIGHGFMCYEATLYLFDIASIAAVAAVLGFVIGYIVHLHFCNDNDAVAAQSDDMTAIDLKNQLLLMPHHKWYQ